MFSLAAADAAVYHRCHWAQRSVIYRIQVSGKTTVVQISGFGLQKVADIGEMCGMIC